MNYNLYLSILALSIIFYNVNAYAEAVVQNIAEPSHKGVLLDEMDNPVVGHTIRVTSHNRIVRLGFSVITDHNGKFFLDKDLCGDLVLAYGKFRNQGRLISFDKKYRKDIVLYLREDKFNSLTGNVILLNRKVNNATINFYRLNPPASLLVWPPKTLTANACNGKYELDAILPGKYLVSVGLLQGDNQPITTQNNSNMIKGRYISVVDIDSSLKELDLIFPESILNGEIIDYYGKPVTNATIFLSLSVVNSGAGILQFSKTAVTDINGKFSINYLSPGIYDIIISHKDTGIQIKSNIEVKNNTNELFWKLENPIKQNVNVKADILNQSYTMVVSNENSKLRSLIDHNYSAPFDEFCPSPPIIYPSGKYLMFAMNKIYGYSTESSILKFDGTYKINFALKQSGSVKVILTGNSQNISGRVVNILDSDGKQIPRLYNPLWTYDYDFIPAIVLPTCVQGITYIDWLSPGNYTLTIDDKKILISVQANEVTTVNIDL